MFPIGTRVRWRDEIAKSGWIGVVTGHPQPRMVECDGRGAISVGLLEAVGEMVETDNGTALAAERDALQALVMEQAEALGALVEKLDNQRDEMEKLREASEKWEWVGSYVADILSEVMGSSNPASLETCPLLSVKRLAEFVRGD